MSDKKEPIMLARDAEALTRLEPGQLISEAIQTGAGVETLERLLAMATQVRQESAREAWHEAMAAFQADVPPLPKTMKATVRAKGGDYTYGYAPLQAMLPVIRPVLAAHGISVTFKTTFGKGCMVAICRVAHERGHVEETEFMVPIDTEARISGAQQMGVASSYARRYAMIAALGIAPEDDPDARGTGNPETITPPKRKSEAADTAPASDVEISVETTIESVTEKTGKKKTGEKWTRWGIKCGDGKTYGTFSSTVADAAKVFAGTGEPVCLWYRLEGDFLTAVGVTVPGAPE